MANMLFTVFGILSPMAYNIFLILVVIGFFGIFIPWNERKKKGSGQRDAEKVREQKGTPAPMSRARALVRIAYCVPVFVVGMTMLIASSVMGEPVMIALGGFLTIFSLLRMERAGRDFRAGRTSPPSKPPRPVFRPESSDHEHITVSGPGTEARLEQLEILKNAGLLTEEEYRKKRKETLREH